MFASDRRFSLRASWDLKTNPLARIREERAAAGQEILDLTVTNPTTVGIPYPGDGIRSALADPRGLVYHPDPRGDRVARTALARYYETHGCHVSPDRIFLFSSTSEAYGALFKLLGDPGDEVLGGAPSYPLFDFLARLDSLELRSYRLEHHGRWRIDPDSMTPSPRTRALLVVNPNNPTGSHLEPDDRELVLDRCGRHRMALISDEVFLDFPLEDPPERISSLAGEERVLAFTLGGLSKLAGLPQVKLSWAVISGPEALAREASDRLEVICDTYLSVSTPVQVALPRLLVLAGPVRDAIGERTRGNLAFLRRRLAGTPVSALHAGGGWMVMLRIPEIMPEEGLVAQLLRETGVLVHPGFFYDTHRPAVVVISLLTPLEVLARGVDLLLEHLERLSLELRGPGPGIDPATG